MPRLTIENVSEELKRAYKAGAVSRGMTMRDDLTQYMGARAGVRSDLINSIHSLLTQMIDHEVGNSACTGLTHIQTEFEEMFMELDQEA